MNIETPENLAEQLADWLGIYGGCKSNGDDGCDYNIERPFCCRQGFTGAIVERMRGAVDNEQKLLSAGIIIG